MIPKISFDFSLIVNIACGIILAGVVGHIVLWAAFAIGGGMGMHERNNAYGQRGERKMMQMKDWGMQAAPSEIKQESAE